MLFRQIDEMVDSGGSRDVCATLLPPIFASTVVAPRSTWLVATKPGYEAWVQPSQAMIGAA
jgi:hypothetical protein